MQTVAQGSFTWGLIATGAAASPRSGKGVKIAVLDTGFAMDHADFAGRTIIGKSFVPDQKEHDVHDVQGHGTHCAGTACGPRSPASQIGYGVAWESDLHVAKVLNDVGSGQESWILAGLEWAIDQGCAVISMSLGRRAAAGEGPDPFYERAGQYALDNGCLVIAAAGNDSWRQYNEVRPLRIPANSTTIMAVAAVNAQMNVANFSNGGVTPGVGSIDIAGPGVDVLSSLPTPRNYERLSGTSMATPHVAGLAALYAESDPNLRGRRLWEALERNARAIGSPPRDVGAGLAYAP
jgi:subtilisin family serine protease